MIVLTAIGRFFKKIWDWIRQTAWIQPLLIVGIIFGVIFSIPAIVKAVQKGKAAKNTYSAYYNRFKYSLVYESDDPYDSKADKFTTALGKIMGSEAGAEEAFKNEFPSLGEKFFVTYVDKDCAECKTAKEGFYTFEEKLNKADAYKAKKDSAPFNMVTIFLDDENKQTTSSEPAFWKYLERHLDFFADVGAAATDFGYVLKNQISETKLTDFENAEPSKFDAPTIMLVELGATAAANNRTPGVTELMFGVAGSDKNERAKTLFDCWTHDGLFSYDI